MITDQSVQVGGRTVHYCLYGPVDGFPVIAHNGSPSTRWRRPEQIEAMHESGVRVLMPDRPGYGGSTRQPGRTVADVVPDVRALADAQGWDRFAVFGGSGGGPHALACAALLPQRVIRCAVLSGVRPRDPAPSPDERTLRSQLEQVADDIMAKIADGGPEFPGEPAAAPARDDPAAMARLRATFVDSHDGWVDDSLAFARPWGFTMPDGAVPVGIWHGTQDTHLSPDNAQWLLTHIPGAQGHQYTGGHRPPTTVYRDIYTWLRQR